MQSEKDLILPILSTMPEDKLDVISGMITLREVER